MNAPAMLVSAIPPGTLLGGRYLVEEKLGDGAVASVYRARAVERDGESVALKVLDPLRAADPVGQQRFRREFDILSRISHPRIARCLFHEELDGLEVLVLEHVSGETLASLLARGRLPIDRALDIARGLTEAVDACHRLDVLHRDLKPANVMIHPERGPVVLDFGVAWFSAAANLTKTGAVVGSPQYLAPEVFASSFVDARADLYAVGAMLFEMLAGRSPYVADNVARLVELHRAGPPPSVQAHRFEVSEELARVVARAIHPRAECRFATARELRRALDELALPAGRELQPRLPCRSCTTPLLIDLPFCPGCGAEVGWDLSTGAYAVQLDDVGDPELVQGWLQSRYGYALTRSVLGLRGRLEQTPVPLTVGASATTAEHLAAEARAVGCSVEVIRARAIVGAKLQVAQASALELVVACTLHFGAVLAAGVVVLLVAPASFAVFHLPWVAGALGVIAARLWVRRPIVETGRAHPHARRTALADEVQPRLAALQCDRARRLAASCVARAAPVLLEGGGTFAPRARGEARTALLRALDAVNALDAHATLLEQRPRARLGAEIADARTRADRNVEGAVEALVALMAEKDTLASVAVAHDLAAREALEGAESVSRALADG